MKGETVNLVFCKECNKWVDYEETYSHLSCLECAVRIEVSKAKICKDSLQEGVIGVLKALEEGGVFFQYTETFTNPDYRSLV